MEYVIWQQAALHGVVEADSINLASIQAQKLKLIKAKGASFNVTPLEDFQPAPSKELLLLKLRCQHYERKINNLQQRARAIEEQVIQAQEIFTKLAREVEDQEQEERTKHCTTCQGKGWIHTFSTEIPKEASDVCPDCANQRRKE